MPGMHSLLLRVRPATPGTLLWGTLARQGISLCVLAAPSAVFLGTYAAVQPSPAGPRKMASALAVVAPGQGANILYCGQ